MDYNFIRFVFLLKIAWLARKTALSFFWSATLEKLDHLEFVAH